MVILYHTHHIMMKFLILPSSLLLITTVATLLFVVLLDCASGLSVHQKKSDAHQFPATRRAILSIPPKVIIAVTGASAITLTASSSAANAATSNGLILITSKSGLKWADAKLGTGQPLKPGQVASIDYSMASTVGRQPQIYTTKDKGMPYRWTLGDGSTIAVSRLHPRLSLFILFLACVTVIISLCSDICSQYYSFCYNTQGIELAILGSSINDNDESISPMLPGGIRRVIIPANLGYQSILSQSKPKCLDGQDLGPIPPKNNSDGGYQRWYQFYCNPRIPYQPDIVLDIKLYGKR